MLLRWSLIEGLFEQSDQILPSAFHEGRLPPPPMLKRLLNRTDGRKGGMKCPCIVPLHHCVFCVSIIEVPLDFSSTQWAGGPIPVAAKATWLPSLVWRAVVLTDRGFDEGPTTPKLLSTTAFYTDTYFYFLTTTNVSYHVKDNSKNIDAGGLAGWHVYGSLDLTDLG